MARGVRRAVERKRAGPRALREAFLVGATLLLGACATPPDDGPCATRQGESGIEIDCGPTPESEWSDRALEEAQEGFEDRGPDRR